MVLDSSMRNSLDGNKWIIHDTINDEYTDSNPLKLDLKIINMWYYINKNISPLRST